MAIQQLSPDVYYVTPPGQNFNQFSSFMSSYLKTRTPWTQRLFEMRVRALDPSARLAALQALERSRMTLEKSYQKDLAAYEEARAEASEPVTYLKGKENTLLQNRLLDLERKAIESFNETLEKDPFEDKSKTASTWLAETLPRKIKSLAKQIDRGGVKYDAEGKVLDQETVSSGSWAGKDTTPAQRKAGASWGTGEGEAMTRLVDMVDRLSERLGEPSLRELAQEIMPEDQRYRPSADEQALDALVAPQKPPGADYWEGRREEINAAYKNPFGKIGGALPEGSYEPRKKAPPAIEILFGKQDKPQDSTQQSLDTADMVADIATTAAEDREKFARISDALPQDAAAGITWGEGLPTLQEEPVETDEEMYRRLAQEYRDGVKAQRLGVDELPKEPVYQRGFYDELVGGEDQGGYGPSMRQTLEIKPGEEQELGAELETLNEADKIAFEDPRKSASIQSVTAPYKLGDESDLADWMPFAEQPPGSPFAPSYQSQWAKASTPESEPIIESVELDPRLTASGIATRKGIDNTPNEQQAAALRRLKAAVIDPLEQYGEVTSAFRSKELNEDEEIGGADNSRHIAGLAVDLAPTKGKTLEELTKAANALKAAGVVEKVIVYPPKGDKTGHVHIAMRRES